MASPVTPEYRTWWVFYIDPTGEPGEMWKSAGCIGGPFTADEAIAQTVGRRFHQPFWAFALDKGEHGSYYDLHYPPDYTKPRPTDTRRIGPGGYVAEPKSSP